ncbi:CAAX amino terminal protease [Lactococcus lactis subsp. lactis NCDO 2118]|jgi:membrane protease YdiL (CAAX protease family)|uniref:CAAX amino terminal protease n=1 Tax=Lactococcus lactis subsp. lactis NCDO 2118 TaxID=1117941 RepID=A0ABC8A2Z3_LACLL|nr:CPBP family intramembrane glutamic endopeptidase [Lactococcus lactis]ABX75560.1 CAAX amino terminal protease family protein [Lactococcus lactis subsp. lactis KF147]AII11592.1 CAAX amino terminal protease [Lactococcus lactis subsp. lactis NCDO 2118]
MKYGTVICSIFYYIESIGGLKIQPLFFKKQFIAILLIILSLIFLVGYDSISLLSIYYLLFVLSLTLFPYLKFKLSYSYNLQVILLGIVLYFPIFNINMNEWIGNFTISQFLISAIFLLVLLYTIHWKELMQHYNTLNSYIKLTLPGMVGSLFEFFYYIIGEEIFYRFFIIGYLSKSINILLCVFIGSILFVYSHYLNRWANIIFTNKSYISLFLLGVFLSLVFYQTHSLLLCIILHIIYNHSELIVIYKRFKVKNIDEKSDVFDDYD